MTTLPVSVTRVIWMLRGLVLLGAVTAILVAVFQDALLRSWSAGYPADSTIEPPEFVPVSTVLFVVTAGLILVLVPFLRTAHPWARWSLAAIVASVLFSTVAGLRTNPPLIFVLVAAISVVVDLIILALLFRKDTNAFLRGSAISVEA